MTVQTETICFPDGSFVIKTVRGKHSLLATVRKITTPLSSLATRTM